MEYKKKKKKKSAIVPAIVLLLKQPDNGFSGPGANEGVKAFPSQKALPTPR
jgi:hypothetical protein